MEEWIHIVASCSLYIAATHVVVSMFLSIPSLQRGTQQVDLFMSHTV